ncbi:Serine/threonine-protein kinase LMTK1, partial [Ophiophagus hannah]
MVANLLAIVMSASFFNPSFAFSSHFDPVLLMILESHESPTITEPNSAYLLKPDKVSESYYFGPDCDGTPLSELSWSSSLVVVAVSFSGLFTFIFLMLACLCCKKGGIGFKNSPEETAWPGLEYKGQTEI